MKSKEKNLKHANIEDSQVIKKKIYVAKYRWY